MTAQVPISWRYSIFLLENSSINFSSRPEFFLTFLSLRHNNYVKKCSTSCLRPGTLVEKPCSRRLFFKDVRKSDTKRCTFTFTLKVFSEQFQLSRSWRVRKKRIWSANKIFLHYLFWSRNKQKLKVLCS